MTIEYKDSKRIVALSTDTVETPTYSDDFSSYSDQTAADAAWITNSTTEFRANPTNDNLDIDGGLGTSSALCTKDFGAGNISDTKWVLRFDINVTEYTKSTLVGNEHSMLIGLSDVNTDIWNASHDSITIGVYYSNGEAVYKIASADGTSHYSGTRTNTSTIPSVDHLWFELIRTSATGATLNIYTDEYVTLDSTTSITVSSTCANLRYFHLNIEATGNPNGNYVGVLDNIKLFNGISSLTSKPTNVQDNSLLLEKDTARRYWFEDNPLLDDNFSSDNFTHADTKTSVSNDKFNWEIELDNSDDTAYQALGFTLDNSSWVMRFKINFATLSTAGNPGAFGKFVLASTNAGQSGTFDWIGFERYVSNPSNTWNLGYGDGTSGNTATDGFTTTPAASSTYYMELIRDGTTITGKMFTGSDYSTGLVDTTTLSMSGTIENLSYFKFYNRSDNTNTSQTATGSLEDLKVWNGVTTASGGGEWTMQPTYEDDFSSDSGYTFTSGNSISGGRLTAKPAGSLGFTKPLGFTMDNTFVVRVHGYELQSGYSWSSSMSYYFGFSDTATNTAYNGGGSAWGFKIFNRSGSNTAINNVWTKVNGTKTGGGNSTVGENGTDLVVGTKYYIEMKKTGNTTGELRIYSDSDFTTLHSTAYITDSAMGNPTGLNHFALQGQTLGGTHIFKVDKIEIWNGVTSIN